MQWMPFPQTNPNDTGNYIASIRRQLALGHYVFSDLCHYNADTQRWYKYDPFVDNYIPAQDITNIVVGWMENMVTYNGV
jgi:hypothetical protein